VIHGDGERISAGGAGLGGGQDTRADGQAASNAAGIAEGQPRRQGTAEREVHGPESEAGNPVQTRPPVWGRGPGFLNWDIVLNKVLPVRRQPHVISINVPKQTQAATVGTQSCFDAAGIPVTGRSAGPLTSCPPLHPRLLRRFLN
jgi:hypothetical protein